MARFTRVLASLPVATASSGTPGPKTLRSVAAGPHGIVVQFRNYRGWVAGVSPLHTPLGQVKKGAVSLQSDSSLQVGKQMRSPVPFKRHTICPPVGVRPQSVSNVQVLVHSKSP